MLAKLHVEVKENAAWKNHIHTILACPAVMNIGDVSIWNLSPRPTAYEKPVTGFQFIILTYISKPP